jgi:hypothetical protein
MLWFAPIARKVEWWVIPPDPKAVGADAYCRDAAVAVETAKDFMARRHNQQRPA